jgi:lysozyme family protein
MTDLVALQRMNAQRWASARATWNFVPIATRLISPAARSRYQAVSAKTGVPWPLIAVIHDRESSQDWTKSLAQGDRWDTISVHVPAGRGPFKSWEDAAVDALDNCPPYAGHNRDWSIGALLTLLEQYNGLGYAARGVPSPYVWAGTDQYRSGKYIRDGVYAPDVIDSQAGCAGLLMAMKALDPAIAFTGPAARPVIANTSTAAAPKSPTLAPSLKNPARGSISAWLVSALLPLFAVFKSKGK